MILVHRSKTTAISHWPGRMSINMNYFFGWFLFFCFSIFDLCPLSLLSLDQQPRQSLKCLVDILSILGTGFDVVYIVGLCKRHGLLSRNLSLTVQISLVAYQQYVCLWRTLCFDLLKPVLGGIDIRRLVSYVKCNHEGMST